jgi:hypothetical protein
VTTSEPSDRLRDLAQLRRVREAGPMTAAPRSRAQRRRDTEHRLAHDVDGATSRWCRVTPRRIQARREVDELPDRDRMREGTWLR